MHLFFWCQKLTLFKDEVERLQLLNLVVFTSSVSVDALDQSRTHLNFNVSSLTLRLILSVNVAIEINRHDHGLNPDRLLSSQAL